MWVDGAVLGMESGKSTTYAVTLKVPMLLTIITLSLWSLAMSPLQHELVAGVIQAL